MTAEEYLRSKQTTVSFDLVRRVWAELTRNPQASYRELGKRAGVTYGHARYAVAMLVAAGYVECAFNRVGARRIIIPFYVEEN